MDPTESTVKVLDRIKKIVGPETASKIVGHILWLENSEDEMLRLALAPDSLLQEKVHEVKLKLLQEKKHEAKLGIIPTAKQTTIPAARGSELPLQYAPFTQSVSSPVTSFRVPSTSCWDSQLGLELEIANSCYVSQYCPDSASYRTQNQAQLINFEDRLDHVNVGLGGFPSDYLFLDGSSLGNLNVRGNLRSPTLPDFPITTKTCHYFNKGFCKHGSNCKYLHTGYSVREELLLYGGDDHVFSPGSLEKLEFEIVELLKSRRGNPVSIASLPMLYYDKYGRTLQAEGYLTESQRHGRAGYSLTKLLARLRGIRLIERAHGQHYVILAEDAAKYDSRNISDRKDPGPIVNGSRQIYLTYPAESTFTEEDVSNYFSTFGTVEDVRLPGVRERMYGFVTFSSATTVKIVFAKGNPHYVCGSRVLVKPYRENSRHIERRHLSKRENHVYTECCLSNRCGHSVSRGSGPPRFWRRQIEEQEEALERQRKALSELQLFTNPVASNQPYLGYAMEEPNNAEDVSNFDYLFDFLSSGSRSSDD